MTNASTNSSAVITGRAAMYSGYRAPYPNGALMMPAWTHGTHSGPFALGGNPALARRERCR